jgi:hypothetical protein
VPRHDLAGHQAPRAGHDRRLASEGEESLSCLIPVALAAHRVGQEHTASAASERQAAGPIPRRPADRRAGLGSNVGPHLPASGRAARLWRAARTMAYLALHLLHGSGKCLIAAIGSTFIIKSAMAAKLSGSMPKA